MANHFKECDKSQGQFISVIPDEQITEGSFDETVQPLMDHVCDLSDFEAEYKNAKGGASAYPPSVLLNIILAAYSRGITSSRKIETLCKYNTVFMCLAGFLTPDHSTIAAFVSKKSALIEDLFVQVVVECDYLGLVGGTCFSIDGTKMSSNASKDTSGIVEGFQKKYKKIHNGIRFLMQQHKEEDQSGRVEPERRAREEKRIKKLRHVAKTLKSTLSTLEDKVGGKGQAKKTNLTDPDSSTLMSGSGGATQGYMSVAVVDEDYQVITAADIAATTEQNSFIPRLNQVEANLDIDSKISNYWRMRVLSRLTIPITALMRASMPIWRMVRCALATHCIKTEMKRNQPLANAVTSGRVNLLTTKQGTAASARRENVCGWRVMAIP